MSRRRLSQLVAALLPSLPRLARAQVFDQGIGGTGVVGDPKDEPSDQMIGGTGVVGTIRRFGSIYVNELRITYADDLPVTRDGQVVKTKDLKLGQVVRVAADQGGSDLKARSITIQHEVVGPVEKVETGRLTVLGQAVSLETKPEAPTLTVGEHVAVSGLRRLDGTIVASLIEAVAPGQLRVAGPVSRSADGTPSIGALPIAKIDPDLVGRRVFLVGHKVGAKLAVTGFLPEHRALNLLGTPHLSIEAYVARTASGLQLGSGLRLDGAIAADATEQLAVITVTVADKDHLVAEKVEAVTPSTVSTRPARDDEHQARGKKGDKPGSNAGDDGGNHASGRSGSGSGGGSSGGGGASGGHGGHH